MIRQLVNTSTTVLQLLQILGNHLLHIPPLVLKARHLGGSAFCNVDRLGVLEQALGRIPLL